MDIRLRLKELKVEFERKSSKAYLESLVGTIGADPLFKKTVKSEKKENLEKL